VEAVEKTLPQLTVLGKAMVLFGWHTGARPGEIISLTTGMINQSGDVWVAHLDRQGMINQSGDVWVAHLDRHKNAHRGFIRKILIGRAAQALLEPWLRYDAPDAPIFSPLRADAR
jgi:hypothetical protein